MLNIEQARIEKEVALVDIADYLGIKAQTVRDKINGTYPFKFDEAVKIQQKFFPEYDLKYLFHQLHRQLNFLTTWTKIRSNKK